MVKKILGGGVVVSFTLVLWAVLWLGGWDVLSALMGRPTDNHFAYVVLASLGFVDGQLAAGGGLVHIAASANDNLSGRHALYN